jgi:GNAT superfamily N-acetyltransferase
MTSPPIEDFVFQHANLPRELDIQLWAFARLVWGENLRGDARFRSRSWDNPPPTHFVRVAGDLLISHALVLPLRFQTDRGVLLVGGVGAVLTFPQFRREGHASAVMRRAAEHIDQTADVGMLFCDVRNVPLYERLGWETLPRGRVLVKDQARHDVVMILGEAGVVPDPFRLDWSW